MQMREIKFRAWNKDEGNGRGRWTIETPLWVFNNGGQMYPYYPSGQVVLMQYTGLKAKGVEIYEGDVVKTEYGNFEVCWRTELAGWYIKKPDGWIEFLTPGLGNAHTLEVIGNIYENPELLEDL
jgi:hypothetical protein